MLLSLIHKKETFFPMELKKSVMKYPDWGDEGGRRRGKEGNRERETERREREGETGKERGRRQREIKRGERGTGEKKSGEIHRGDREGKRGEKGERRKRRRGEIQRSERGERGKERMGRG